MRSDIINHLISLHGYKSYLEIGVYNKDWNFNKINCNHKVGVDPELKVGADFTVTSDTFFEHNEERFDIIFIDGLHHEEQVNRDIQNSLHVLNKGGSIVVHDCNPTTKEMQQVPRIQGEWTGDVWRSWLHWRSQPDLSMKVYDCDYGVGVIQRGNQKPLQCGTPTYEQFTKNKKEWLNLVEYISPVSICIPAFEQYGKGVKTLKALLESLRNINPKHEVIVSDNSDDDKLLTLCQSFNVKYYHNPIKGISANTNYAISKASHSKIKIMYQDDISLSYDMPDEFSLALDSFGWVASHSIRIDEQGRKGKPITPVYTDGIIQGKNTLGMPSVIGFNRIDYEFDEKLKTLLDCDFYYRLHKEYGMPGIIKKHLIGARYWDGSTSRKQGNKTLEELPYIKKKWQLT